MCQSLIDCVCQGWGIGVVTALKTVLVWVWDLIAMSISKPYGLCLPGLGHRSCHSPEDCSDLGWGSDFCNRCKCYFIPTAASDSKPVMMWAQRQKTTRKPEAGRQVIHNVALVSLCSPSSVRGGTDHHAYLLRVVESVCDHLLNVAHHGHLLMCLQGICDGLRGARLHTHTHRCT